MQSNLILFESTARVKTAHGVKEKRERVREGERFSRFGSLNGSKKYVKVETNKQTVRGSLSVKEGAIEGKRMRQCEHSKEARKRKDFK